MYKHTSRPPCHACAPCVGPPPPPRRAQLYIGSLVPGAVTDMSLRQLFDAAVSALAPSPSGLSPVVNTNLHSDGRYAFVEFRTPEDATTALLLNGQVGVLRQLIRLSVWLAGWPAGCPSWGNDICPCHAAPRRALPPPPCRRHRCLTTFTTTRPAHAHPAAPSPTPPPNPPHPSSPVPLPLPPRPHAHPRSTCWAR